MPPVTKTPQSSRDVLRERFESFDENHNGHIDRREFAALLQSLGAGLSQAEADRAFSDIDADGSGSIDFDEFCRFWRVEP